MVAIADDDEQEEEQQYSNSMRVGGSCEIPEVDATVSLEIPEPDATRYAS
jgi:hypothetical protein